MAKFKVSWNRTVALTATVTLTKGVVVDTLSLDAAEARRWKDYIAEFLEEQEDQHSVPIRFIASDPVIVDEEDDFGLADVVEI